MASFGHSTCVLVSQLLRSEGDFVAPRSPKDDEPYDAVIGAWLRSRLPDRPQFRLAQDPVTACWRPDLHRVHRIVLRELAAAAEVPEDADDREGIGPVRGSEPVGDRHDVSIAEVVQALVAERLDEVTIDAAFVVPARPPPFSTRRDVRGRACKPLGTRSKSKKRRWSRLLYLRCVAGFLEAHGWVRPDRSARVPHFHDERLGTRPDPDAETRELRVPEVGLAIRLERPDGKVGESEAWHF